MEADDIASSVAASAANSVMITSDADALLYMGSRPSAKVLIMARGSGRAAFYDAPQLYKAYNAAATAAAENVVKLKPKMDELTATKAAAEAQVLYFQVCT